MAALLVVLATAKNIHGWELCVYVNEQEIVNNKNVVRPQATGSNIALLSPPVTQPSFILIA
jgi:hypothetical protein